MWQTQKKTVGRFKPLTAVTDVGRGGNTIQVSKKQPTNQMKGKEKRTQNTHIYAQLSIILM